MLKLTSSAAAAALIALAASPCALAQVSASGGVSSYDIGQTGISVGQTGVSVQADPQKGASVEVNAGDAGVTVGAGPQGVKLDLRQNAVPVAPGASTPPQPTGREQPAPAGRGDAPAAKAPASEGSDDSSPAAAGGSAQRAGAGTGPAQARGGADSPAGSADRRADADTAAERRGSRGVAPVLDFIEEIPRAVWAGLVALALIALAMWLMWVRGRRRLERNAWVDAETGTMNVVAFETLLAQEWTRSGRYHRPLGLLLLDLEEEASGGGRRPLGDKRARRAWNAITERVREADTVAQLSASRFAVICPESSHGSAETLARALEKSLEAEQVHARVGVGERFETDRGPADLVSRAAAGLERSGSWGGVAAPSPDESPALHVAA